MLTLIKFQETTKQLSIISKVQINGSSYEVEEEFISKCTQYYNQINIVKTTVVCNDALILTLANKNGVNEERMLFLFIYFIEKK